MVPSSNQTPTAKVPSYNGEKMSETRSTVFGKYSLDYDKFRPSYPQLGIAATVDIAKTMQNGGGKEGDTHQGIHVVDLACGTGQASKLYACEEAVHMLTCVDHDERMLEECKKIVTHESQSLKVHLGSAEETGLPDSCCDLVGGNTI